MCFSATASFAASGLLAIIGLVSLHSARTYALRLFAATPLFFALQQAIEGIIWITHASPEYARWYQYSTYGYIFFAYLFWPIWIPLVMSLFETQPWRACFMRMLLAFGTLFSLSIFFYLLKSSAVAAVATDHIRYMFDTPSTYYMLGKMIYCAIVILPFWLSTVPYMRIFAIGITLSYAATEIWYAYHLTSVWCFFAALVSGLTLFIVKKQSK